MRKNKIEPKKKPAPAPVFPTSELGRNYFDPKPDSWTYQNFGPGGYIDAHGVPCAPDRY